MQSTKITRGNHGDCRLREQKTPAPQRREGVHLRFHPQNGKSQTRKRDLAVEPSQQPRSAKRRRQFAGPVEHATNHVRVRMVRYRDAVIRKDDDANRTSFHRNVVDFKSAVVVDRRGQLFEISGQSGGVNLADKNLRETRLWSRSGGAASPTLRVVNRESGLIEVALELKTGFFDKLLVLGLARNRWKLAGSVECAYPLQIDVKEPVGSR